MGSGVSQIYPYIMDESLRYISMSASKTQRGDFLNDIQCFGRAISSAIPTLLTPARYVNHLTWRRFEIGENLEDQRWKFA
jgi:hypothetical protein